MGERALRYFEVNENYYISEKNNVLSISEKKIQFFSEKNNVPLISEKNMYFYYFRLQR